MRLLLRTNTGDLELTKDFIGHDTIPSYAILSHTWEDDGEVSFRDLIEGTGKGKTGYNKIQFCGRQAERDGLRYFWVDTCCIDKSNHVELQEAINSMFYWYQNAVKCYVYLSDVSTGEEEGKAVRQCSQFTWGQAFRESRWFTRGWTLQELLAPRSVEFFSKEGNRLGDKTSLERQIHEITGITTLAIRGYPLSEFGVEERLSWIRNRQTTRQEDKAYFLLGIFGIYMSLIYGEGERHAFRRLREEIDKPVKDLSQQHGSIHMEQEGLLSWLCPVKISTDHTYTVSLDTRFGLSGRWFLETKDSPYLAWIKGDLLNLWVTGPPGCGKTVLLASALEDLYKRQERFKDRVAILSYWFDYKNSEETPINTFLESIIRQLLQQEPSGFEGVKQLRKSCKMSQPSKESKWATASNLIALFDRVYLIIDGVNECESPQELLERIGRLVIRSTHGSKSAVQLLVAAPYSNVTAIGVASLGDHQIIRVNEKNHEDIQDYIREKLSKMNLLHNGRLEHVTASIAEKANGLFIYARLTINTLSSYCTEKELEDMAKDLPAGLPELYEIIFERVLKSAPDEQYKNKLLRMAQWLCESNYCLPLPEFAAIMGLEEQDTRVESKNIARDPGRLCDRFPGLITIDWTPMPPELAFSHPTIELYLLSPQCKRGKAGRLHFTRHEAQKRLTEDCLHYLTLENFSSPAINEERQFNSLKRFRGGTGIYVKPDQDYWRFQERLQTYKAYDYTSLNLFEHYRRACYTTDEYEGIKHRFEWFLHDESISDDRGHYRSWQEAHAFFCNSSTCNCGAWQPPLYFAIVYGLDHIFQDLLAYYHGRLEEKCLDGQTPLVLALNHNRLRIAKYLLVEKHVSPKLHGNEKLQKSLQKCERLSLQALVNEEAETHVSTSRVELTREQRKGEEPIPRELPSIPGGSKICRLRRRCHHCEMVFSVQIEPYGALTGIGTRIECPTCVNRRREPNTLVPPPENLRAKL